jgi:large conductance mechanosensitive channel
MLEEFKKFALRGNVVDLAIGVIIGAAFGKIVDSLVGDIVMPVIGAVTGGLDFSNYYTALSGAVPEGAAYADAKKQGAVLGWGNFVTVAINFLIIAWVLFLTVKAMNRMKREEDAKVDTPKAPEIPADVKLLSEIRDILKARPAG